MPLAAKQEVGTRVEPAIPKMQEVVVPPNEEKKTTNTKAAEGASGPVAADAPASGGLDPITGKEKTAQ